MATKVDPKPQSVPRLLGRSELIRYDSIAVNTIVKNRLGEVGSGDSNPHWFHIAIFPVTAVNPLKIRQYSLRNLLCYRKNCLCETASTCSAEFLQRISVRKGADGLTPVKTDKAEGFVKIQSTGNAGSSPHCLRWRVPFQNFSGSFNLPLKF